jgi:hypothetical protein
MRALEQIALKYIELHNLDTGTHNESPETYRRWLESEVEKLAPGCSYLV